MNFRVRKSHHCAGGVVHNIDRSHSLALFLREVNHVIQCTEFRNNSSISAKINNRTNCVNVRPVLPYPIMERRRVVGIRPDYHLIHFRMQIKYGILHVLQYVCFTIISVFNTHRTCAIASGLNANRPHQRQYQGIGYIPF